MKKLFITTTLVMVSLFVFAGGVALAQVQQVNLPSAGLTPESPFYFLDKFGEALRTFFTFNPEGKARLQITFAAERISEIKVILETKGVEAKGLKVAQGRLQAHLANAATIVKDQKAEGKDVSALAKELDDDFEGPKTALEQTFKAEKRALEVQEKELKRKILEARRAGDTAQVESLVQQLGQVKAQKELLELKEEEAEDALEKEEERIEEEMEAKEEAEKAIRKAEKEKQEVLDEAAEEDVAVPAEAFGKFDGLLAQAKSALAAGNFEEAKSLAKQAEKSLDAVEEAIEDLEEAKEKEEELKEELEEKEREAKEEEEELKENPEEIYPFRTDEVILIKPESISTFETKSGLKIKAASDQLLVYFNADVSVSEEEIKDFVRLVHDYNGYIVGQIPDSKIIQIKIKHKEALLNLKKELENISYIKHVEYNMVAGLDIKDKDIPPEYDYLKHD